MGNIPRPPIYKIPLAQLSVLLPLGVAMWFYDATTSYSFLLGGLIHLIPNVYFAIQAFRYRGARQMRQTMGALAKGEILKFLMCVIGLVLAVIYLGAEHIVALFIGFIVMTVVHVIATAKYLVR